MHIQIHRCPYKLSDQLIELFQQTLTTRSVNHDKGLVLHFRDPNYGPESGGFHPIEVGFSGQGVLLYITEFAYVGRQPFVELAKNLDFDFQCACFQQFGREYPLAAGVELFQLWQDNFLQYHAMGVFETSVAVI